jgi:two-component sensor histidine kinase
MFRAISLPVRLAILVAGTTLPLIGFAAAIVYQHYLQDRKEAFDRVEQFTHSIQLVLDRELQGMVSGLTVLANSDTVMRGDFEGFRRSADAFLAQFPDHPSLTIGDPSGQLLFSSSMLAGTPLPIRADQPKRGEVFRTGKPAFSPLFIGTVSHKPIVIVTVPVFRDGKVVYDMSFGPPLQIFQHIIEQQKPSPDWTISIFDQTGVNFARVPNPNATIGRKASPSLYAVMFSAPEGQARTVSLEGVPLLTAFVRSDLTQWVAAAGIAERTLTAPALRTLLFTAALGIAMLVIGLGFAIRMATRIARAEALHMLLVDELNHRVKNTLATVQSLSAQTFRNGSDADARGKFDARLVSLGRTHDILSATKWDGADINAVVGNTLAPFESSNPDRIKLSGPELLLSPRTVVMLSMAIHELATNAAKYGALSTAGGRIVVEWDRLRDAKGARAVLHWREIGGPEVKAPARNGFGSTLIEKGFAAQLGGAAVLRFDPAGVSCTLEFPLQ